MNKHFIKILNITGTILISIAIITCSVVEANADFNLTASKNIYSIGDSNEGTSVGFLRPEPQKPSYKKGKISSGVSESHIPFMIYVPKVKSKKVVFVFGGKNKLGDDYGKISYFKEIKNKAIVPNYNVVFVQKEAGSWKQYSQEDIAAMIDEILKDLKAKEIYFVGFSQGVYNSKHIVTSHKKWHGGLFVDGNSDFKWVKKYFKVSAFVAGYIKDSYGKQAYFDYYYEPVDKAFATRNKYVHELVLDWALMPADLFPKYDKNGIISQTPLNAVDVLINEL